MSSPPGTWKMPDICAGGSAWPSVTSVLVTMKLGTTGKRQNGSFMVAPHRDGLRPRVISDRMDDSSRAGGVAWPRRAQSEPPALIRGPDCLGPVARTGLGYRSGQVIADCALGQEQLAGDLGYRRPAPGGHEDVAFPDGERRCSSRQCRGGQRRIDDSLARRDTADRVCQLFRRCILDHETACARLHSPPQVTWPPE